MIKDSGGGYLVYHPQRVILKIGGTTVHCDSLWGNQDPYVWNENFLHSYCHITQMTPEEGHTNFWVSGDKFPDFDKLYCDLIFKVQTKLYWDEANAIGARDSIVDSPAAFEDHYKWANEGHHHFARRRRFTLKADPNKSWQPQTKNGGLIDIVPALLEFGLTKEELRDGLRATKGSKPMRISDEVVKKLTSWLDKISKKIRGEHFQKLRINNFSCQTAKSCCRCQ